MASIKKNFLYSSVLTVSGYLFPLITFPYITRVLGVNNIGICNFVDSIIQYFILFSMMGMMTVGIREVAKTKGDKQLLSRTYSSLLTLNLLTTILAIVVLCICTILVPQMRIHSQLFFIGAAKILSNTLLVEWLFKGLEDFRYITIRSIAIRLVYVILVFVFVRSANDYYIYFFLTTIVVVINAVINLLYSRKFVCFSLKNIEFKPYVKSFFILGLYLFLTSLYTTFNVAYLGFATNTTEVGYYTTATKLYTIIMSMFTAFTGVMMPRMSALVADGEIDEFKRLTNKSIEALLAFAFPIIIIAELCAPQIIRIIAGVGYEGSILPMKIVMPLMLIIGYEQIIIVQMLTPLKKDSAILTNSIIGAGIALIMNIILVPKLASIGSSIVWACCEVTVLISAQCFVYKYIEYKFPIGAFAKRIVVTVPIVFIGFVVNNLISNVFVSLACVAFIILILWLAVEIVIMKNDLLIQNVHLIISIVLRRLSRR